MSDKVANIGVRVGADVRDYKRGMDEASKETEKFRGVSKGLSTTIGAMTTAITAAAGAAVGLGSAMVAMASASAESGAEIQRFSRLAGTTTKQFQELTTGARAFGVESDTLASIFKDVRDKIGDFNANEGGAMADFFNNIAPKVGLTVDAFRDLNGADALQLYIDSLEKANVSQNEMVFYLEAIASDATLLLPLLEDNAKALKALTDGTGKVELISDAELKKLNDLNIALGDSAENITRARDRIVASDGFGAAFNYLTATADKFAQKLSLIFDLTNDIPQTSEGIRKKLYEIKEETAEASEKLLTYHERLIAAEDNARRLGQELSMAMSTHEDPASIGRLDKGLGLAQEKVKAMRAEFEAADKVVQDLSAKAAELNAVIKFREEGLVLDGFEQFLVNANLLAEENPVIVPVKIGADDTEQTTDSWLPDLSEIYEYEQLQTDEVKRQTEERAKQRDWERKQAIAGASQFFGNMSSLMSSENKKLFEIGKAARIAGAIIDGYAAAVSSYKFGASFGGPIAGGALAAASLAATAIQISNIASTQFGSKSQNTSAPSVAPQIPQQQTSQNVQNVNITLEGNTFSRGGVVSLIDQINSEIDGGARLNIGVI